LPLLKAVLNLPYEWATYSLSNSFVSIFHPLYLLLNIVPIPSSVKSSIKIEWGTRPSIINAFFTPSRSA
jgi:hypothetical protein